MSTTKQSTTSKIDVIMFNMSAYSEWQHGYVNRNSHILHGLLADERVRKIISVDYLPFTIKRSLKIFIQNIIRGPQGKLIHFCPHTRVTAVNRQEINKTIYKTEGGVDEVEYKLFTYSTYMSAYSENLMLAELRRQIKKLSLKNIVVWSYLPTFSKCFDVLPARLKVFDAVDNWLEHSAYQKVIERLKLNYEVIGQKADLVFTTSSSLFKLFKKKSGIYYVPNGVRVDDFANLPKVVNRDIAALPRPIIGYIGIIQQDRIDLDLIAYLAKQNPKKSFVFIGPVWSNFRAILDNKLKDFDNVYFLGRKHYEEVPAYLNQFDLGIVPHLVNNFGQSTSLLKVLEYLALGKPVITTPTAGTDQLADMIKIAANPEDFNLAINNALAEDNDDLRAQRRAIAQQNSWQHRIDFMMDKIMAKM